jgi:hypothetical protein
MQRGEGLISQKSHAFDTICLDDSKITVVLELFLCSECVFATH